jgi:hypothetical protein
MPLVSESPAATFRGIEPEAQFGAAVSAAGDVDADGYDDVAVASPYEGTRAGAVRVFRGGAVEAEALAWVTLPAGAGDETFGQALAGAGDLDGDGFDDLAVGAPATLDDSGRLHVFLGGPDGPSPAPSATVEAPEPGSYFAFALSVAGDLDGDALDDLWVGAFRYGVGIGTAIRYAGAADGAVLERADAAIGASTNSNFGQAVAGGGDLDGDGVPDLAVGAPRARSEAGELSVFAGAPALDPEPYAGAAGDARDARLGTALAMGGDVDADGLGDLVVGIPNGADYSGVATARATASERRGRGAARAKTATLATRSRSRGTSTAMAWPTSRSASETRPSTTGRRGSCAAHGQISRRRRTRCWPAQEARATSGARSPAQGMSTGTGATTCWWAPATPMHSPVARSCTPGSRPKRWSRPTLVIRATRAARGTSTRARAMARAAPRAQTPRPAESTWTRRRRSRPPANAPRARGPWGGGPPWASPRGWRFAAAVARRAAARQARARRDRTVAATHVPPVRHRRASESHPTDKGTRRASAYSKIPSVENSPHHSAVPSPATVPVPSMPW